MSKALFETKNEKNKKKLKAMTDEISEEKEDKKSKRKSTVFSHTFICEKCGMSVTLNGDDPKYEKRNLCHRCTNNKQNL